VGSTLSKIKIEQKYISKYSPIVLWWDDVTEIVELLQANAKAVEIETSQYKFTTLDVAKEHMGVEPQYDVKLCATSPYVNLDSSSLYVGAGPTSAQIFMELDKILKRRERRPRWLYSSWLMVPTIGLGLVPLASSLDETTKAILVAVQMIFACLYLRAMFVSMKRKMVVYTQKRSEVRGFLKRNKDQLLMFIITGVVGAIVGFGISQVKDRYFPTAVNAPTK
jgi:hypothetical protein